MSDKLIILITGATAGLGRLTAKKCVDLGHTVIITGRSQSSLDAAKDFILKDTPQFTHNVHQLMFDLADLTSVTKAVEHLGTLNLPCIDVIVHNAGGNETSFQQVHNVEKVFFKNAVAPLYLNRLLWPMIEKSTSPKKRILFVGSSLHDNKNKGGGRSEASRIPDSVDLNDLFHGDGSGWDMMKAYKLSKLGCVWDAYCLARRSPDVPVAVFCPGFVPTTDLARHSSFMLRLVMKYVLPYASFTTSEEESTDDYVYYITSDAIENGKHYQKRLITESSKDSLDETKQEAYWKLANKTIDEIIQ
ncbi:uncharacterized protein EV154DRAFT_499313 [Mucor mucedo]|uniref:uncharacterized protein n=1 Tax=Mucor mucedo TaxID=29922 RepID=UPI0022202DD8|nr:uncharacterized protein EV154DRAFT_499313 [Mucor mucedo]KAI7894080.1 hypothetical protein EV154DRAFT_499313 [Mucor mucedo]